jgi:LmbE family N-acetylglucosaminyl deacetylase
MRLEFSDARLLAVVAHPDDAELLCAGTLARARDDGAAIALCVLCRGDKGQPAGERIADLAEVRRCETAAAAALLGAELHHGNSGDSALADDEDTRLFLLDVVRGFRPTLLLAHAPQDYHVDHRTASQLAEVVSWQCASRGVVSASPPLDAPPELWWLDTIGMHAFEPGLYVDVSRHVALKEQMLACHESQLRRAADADFAPLADLMRAHYQTRGRQSGVVAAEAFLPYHAFKRVRAW